MALTDKLAAIGDQVRRICGLEDPLTLDQMEVNLMNVLVGNELPNAEDFAFGVDNATKAYGLSTVGNIIDGSVKRTYGYKFTVSEAISLLGFRITGIGMSNPATVCLWDSDGNEVVRKSLAWTSGEWTEYLLDAPINMVSGSTYTFGLYGGSSDQLDSATFNSKLTNTGCFVNSENGLSMPTRSTTSFPSADIIIASVQAELPDTYQVQRTTMDDIAEEVQRITGATYKLSTAQIITALQGVAVQTTE